MNTKDSYGEMFRRRRLELGLTLRAVCERTEITPSYLSDIENDRRIPAESKLEKLASILGLDLEYLLASSGRLGDDFKSYLKQHPIFCRLIHRIVDADLQESDLIKLMKLVESIDGRPAQVRKEAGSKMRR